MSKPNTALTIQFGNQVDTDCDAWLTKPWAGFNSSFSGKPKGNPYMYQLWLKTLHPKLFSEQFPTLADTVHSTADNTALANTITPTGITYTFTTKGNLINQSGNGGSPKAPYTTLSLNMGESISGACYLVNESWLYSPYVTANWVGATTPILDTTGAITTNYSLLKGTGTGQPVNPIFDCYTGLISGAGSGGIVVGASTGIPLMGAGGVGNISGGLYGLWSNQNNESYGKLHIESLANMGFAYKEIPNCPLPAKRIKKDGFPVIPSNVVVTKCNYVVALEYWPPNGGYYTTEPLGLKIVLDAFPKFVDAKQTIDASGKVTSFIPGHITIEDQDVISYIANWGGCMNFPQGMEWQHGHHKVRFSLMGVNFAATVQAKNNPKWYGTGSISHSQTENVVSDGINNSEYTKTIEWDVYNFWEKREGIPTGLMVSVDSFYIYPSFYMLGITVKNYTNLNLQYRIRSQDGWALYEENINRMDKSVYPKVAINGMSHTTVTVGAKDSVSFYQFISLHGLPENPFYTLRQLTLYFLLVTISKVLTDEEYSAIEKQVEDSQDYANYMDSNVLDIGPSAVFDENNTKIGYTLPDNTPVFAADVNGVLDYNPEIVQWVNMPTYNVTNIIYATWNPINGHNAGNGPQFYYGPLSASPYGTDSVSLQSCNLGFPPIFRLAEITLSVINFSETDEPATIPAGWGSTITITVPIGCSLHQARDIRLADYFLAGKNDPTISFDTLNAGFTKMINVMPSAIPDAPLAVAPRYLLPLGLLNVPNKDYLVSLLNNFIYFNYDYEKLFQIWASDINNMTNSAYTPSLGFTPLAGWQTPAKTPHYGYFVKKTKFVSDFYVDTGFYESATNNTWNTPLVVKAQSTQTFSNDAVEMFWQTAFASAQPGNPATDYPASSYPYSAHW